MSPALYHLAGWPGTGKRTVGLALAGLTGARLIDNHLMADPIFQAVGADGLSPLPDGTRPLVLKVWAATLEAVRDLAPRHLSHIFTSHLGERPAGQEHEIVAQLREVARVRGARYVPVWLSCDAAELLRRVAQPDRAAKLKLRDPELLAKMLQAERLLAAPPEALSLDVTTLDPGEAARQIVAFAGVPA